MRRFLVASLLFSGVLASCAPAQQGSERMVTVTPVLIKVSESAARGGTVALTGRGLPGTRLTLVFSRSGRTVVSNARREFKR